MPAKRCVAVIYGDGRGGQGCSRKGIVTSKNGKIYCKQHLPETVEAKNKEKQEKWEAEWILSKRRYEAQTKEKAARRNLLGAIRSPLAEDILMAAKAWEETVMELEAYG